MPSYFLVEFFLSKTSVIFVVTCNLIDFFFFEGVMEKVNEAAGMEIDDPNSNISDQISLKFSINVGFRFAKLANWRMTWTPATDDDDGRLFADGGC
ncbi:hypothetical protein E1A91_D10G137300v1 [Gossypium mustelinum]|uniref:Uncharacterized protein n=4 Tax=Gossypium TaxID=3633 RepID=A0A0D2UTJ0_GOSRA|nr:hypothetical protein B456_011G134100 [Gossypium raimondii]TYG50021.1 hypothetical protein ES288_D10G142500v1 [Gossypium darwinii]TYH49536.1 hypothetical protein ES332_D10G144200v1 [Gossypium tomentosum]TYI60911.1 hypothetical protein E1A91_D10G137300v1 [Gossypium mustelinum]